MSRPREPLADAMRLARTIVVEEGAALAQAARGAKEEAIEAASHRLTLRIAQALVDAEREATERAAEIYEDSVIPQFALFARVTH